MTQACSYTFDHCRKTLISDNTTGYHGIDFSFQEGLSNFHKKTKQNKTRAVFLFLLWYFVYSAHYLSEHRCVW